MDEKIQNLAAELSELGFALSAAHDPVTELRPVVLKPGVYMASHPTLGPVKAKDAEVLLARAKSLVEANARLKAEYQKPDRSPVGIARRGATDDMQPRRSAA